MNHTSPFRLPAALSALALCAAVTGCERRNTDTPPATTTTSPAEAVPPMLPASPASPVTP
jgi:hypothetical protein